MKDTRTLIRLVEKTHAAVQGHTDAGESIEDVIANLSDEERDLWEKLAPMVLDPIAIRELDAVDYTPLSHWPR